MDYKDLPFNSIKDITFTPRPIPVFSNLRPAYKISIITLILHLNCRKNTAPLLNIHFFNWVLKSSSLRNQVLISNSYSGNFSLDYIHLDPTVNIALKFAVGYGLITIMDKNKFALSSRGNVLASSILSSSPPIFSNDIETLKEIGKKITNVTIRNILP